MKAIILTFAPVSKSDAELVKNTKIVKFAINSHAENLKPNFRICSDYNVVNSLLENFSQKVITIREYYEDERTIYGGQVQFKGSTMIACIDYLILQGFKEILIIGDNTARQVWFQERIKKELENILEKYSDIKIFQYKNGNMNLPVKSIQDFIKESEE